MREIVLGAEYKTSLRLDEYISSIFPALPKNAMYKAFRKKNIKINGKWAAPDATPSPFDVVSVYLPDALLFARENAGSNTAYTAGACAAAACAGSEINVARGFTVVYEDKRLLIVNKAQGLPVHPDRNGRGVTLIELVGEYLNKKKESRQPLMCHRIDRNTGGLVAIAKDKDTLSKMLKTFASGAVKKEYRCIVNGKPNPPEATLRAYLAKDPIRGKVAVYQSLDAAPDYAREIVTHYHTLYYDPKSGTSKLEVMLLTGRTHQIRAHLAAVGHPIIGDGKYCPNAINKRFYAPYQMLIAFRLTFPEMSGFDISGKTIEIPDGLSRPALKTKT